MNEESVEMETHSYITGVGKRYFLSRKYPKPKTILTLASGIGEKMPKLVSLPEVLYQVYSYGGLSRTESERPMPYKIFKKIMLGSELVVTEKTIRQKWEQVVAANFAKEGRNSNIIVLNVHAIMDELIRLRLISDKNCALVNEENHKELGSHTQTHTQTEVIL